MDYSIGLYQSILNALSEHIVVIDARGRINFVNSAWTEFALANFCTYTDNWQTINYLNVCDASAATGEPDAAQAADGLRSLVEKKCDRFYLEYPCHSPIEQRWFSMTASPLEWSGEFFLVISHQNITQRMLAEARVNELS